MRVLERLEVGHEVAGGSFGLDEGAELAKEKNFRRAVLLYDAEEEPGMAPAVLDDLGEQLAVLAAGAREAGRYPLRALAVPDVAIGGQRCLSLVWPRMGVL